MRSPKSEILILCSLVFAFQFAFMLDPHARLENPPLFKMFPLSKQLISRPAWVDYFFRDASYAIMIYIMAKFIPGISSRLGVFFWLWFGYIIDYLIIYNEAFAYIGPVPISYSLIAGFIMLGITLKTIYKNDTP